MRLIFIDERSRHHPQIGGMYRGDFRRKGDARRYGFRLPSCMDNRPLRFEEWEQCAPEHHRRWQRPAAWEMEQAGGRLRRTGDPADRLIDPPVEVRSAKTQVDDVLGEIRETAAAGYRTLVTVLTKRMAEDLTEYLHEQGVRVRYMHSDIDTLERIEIIRDLRLGAFDVLVGINLLREGLDIPECGFVAILDADKEGFLRSETSLIQTIGRAARNVDGKVILYADTITGSMQRAMEETSRRREKQMAYNAEHGITPESVKAKISDILDSVYERDHVAPIFPASPARGFADGGHLSATICRRTSTHWEKQMRDAAADLDFEKASTPARRRSSASSGRTGRAGRPDGARGKRNRRRAASGQQGHCPAQRTPSPCGEAAEGQGDTPPGPSGHPSHKGEEDRILLPEKPSLDKYGPGTDTERPLFRKPNSIEMVPRRGDPLFPGRGGKVPERQMKRQVAFQEKHPGRNDRRPHEKPVPGQATGEADPHPRQAGRRILRGSRRRKSGARAGRRARTGRPGR